MDAIHTEKYNGHSIEIYQDEFPYDPRTENDNFGKMVCWHSHYELGDKHNFDSPEDAQEHIKTTDAIVLPLFLYNHSGLTMNTSGFSCLWDSGQVGYIYVERSEILKEYGGKRVGKSKRKKAISLLESEVREYSLYLQGCVYGFTVTGTDGEVTDSCGGYITDNIERDILAEVQAGIDHAVKEKIDREYAERRKQWELGNTPAGTGQICWNF